LKPKTKNAPTRKATHFEALGKQLAKELPPNSRTPRTEAAAAILEIARAAMNHGASLRAVASRMDIDPTVLSRILSGERTSVGIGTAVRVGRALGIDLL
jgi:hypothetical protein